jgi:hypothetical protein
MRMREWTLGLAVMGAMAAGACGVGRAQSIPAQTSGVPTMNSSTSSRGGLDSSAGTRSGVPPALQEKMAIQRNDERQKKLIADTDQLLALATELKAEVDKTDKYTLSLDVVKRTAEIEKLAKSIRERMKE